MPPRRFIHEVRQVWRAGLAAAGLPDDALAWALSKERDGRFLVVLDQADRADRFVRALRFFARGASVVPFPADDARYYDGFSPDPRIPAERLLALDRIVAGGPIIVVASARALLQRVPDRDARDAGTLTLRRGDSPGRSELTRALSDAGYLAVGKVASVGTFAARGDIVDVWPNGAPAPVRIELFDDEIEGIRTFSPETQRTAKPVEQVRVLPVREERLDAAALERFGRELGRLVAGHQAGNVQRRRVIEELRAGVRFSAIEAWLPALVGTVAPLDVMATLERVVVDPDEVMLALRDAERMAAQRYAAMDPEDRPLVPPSERFVPAAEACAALSPEAGAFEVRPLVMAGRAVDLGGRAPESFLVRGVDLAPTAEALRAKAGSGLRVVLVAERAPRAELLLEMLSPHGLRPKVVRSPHDGEPGDVLLTLGDLPRGFVAEDSGMAFIPAGALFGERRAGPSRTDVRFTASVDTLAALRDGDHVVHKLHGIGIFRGVQRVVVKGDLEGGPTDVARAVAAQDCLKLEYRDGDLLYLPATRLDLVSRYHPAHSGDNVRLDRLGGATWATRTGKVRDSLLAMAQALLALSARRELARREPHAPPGPVYRAMEARFPYEETPDQAAAIDAIHEDLGKEGPMDRLLVGDVGFGKTEVAIRAAVRVVEGGRQVAILCPTTVLAYQHHQRVLERVAGLPIRVGMMSRLVDRTEQDGVVDGLRTGTIDVVIGTVALFGAGVKFKDLGLLVIDEEHRFGVKQKSRFQKLRESLDILSMSATPIPRTLEMGLTGMRTMSLMQTPPRDRLSVHTTLARMSEARVRDAILGERERGGQVFFVHNRVADIEAMAARLAEWVPGVRCQVAHGQMTPDALEDALLRFVRKDADVLVCSAIIESGVDLPNVNTIIVNDADRFGLAQLYQLRGRVGRAAVRGRCLLLTAENPTRDAQRRLGVLIEHGQLGAGMQIALADLEIRGAGNLVGDAQSGNIDAVGYETWLELLAEAVERARGAHRRQQLEPDVEVPVQAFVPESMVPDVQERLAWYERFASARTPAEVDVRLEEFEDRLGDAPQEVRNLAGLHMVRAWCQTLGIQRVAWLKVRIVLDLAAETSLGPDAVARVVAAHPKRIATRDERGVRRLEVRFLQKEAEHPFHLLRWLFLQLRDAAR